MRAVCMFDNFKMLWVGAAAKPSDFASTAAAEYELAKRGPAKAARAAFGTLEKRRIREAARRESRAAVAVRPAIRLVSEACRDRREFKDPEVKTALCGRDLNDSRVLEATNPLAAVAARHSGFAVLCRLSAIGRLGRLVSHFRL